MSNRAAQRAIGTFLKSRRQLIVELMRLSQAIEGELRDEAEGLLERFCQDMVDYLSVGYFRIFCGSGLAANLGDAARVRDSRCNHVDRDDFQ